MALIKCKECRKRISNLAEKCPKCGCPVSDEEKNYVQKTSTCNNKPIIIGGIGVGILILIIVVIIVIFSKDKLVCTFNSNNDTGYIDNKVTFTFENEKVKEINAYQLTRPKKLEIAEYLWSIVNNNQEQYNYIDGMSYKATLSENQEIVIRYTVDAEKAPTMFDVATTMAGVDGVTTTSTKKEIIKIFEDANYTCK